MKVYPIFIGAFAGLFVAAVISLAAEQSRLSMEQTQAESKMSPDDLALEIAWRSGYRCDACEEIKRLDPVEYARLGKKCSNYINFRYWRDNVPAMEKLCGGPCPKDVQP